MRDENAAAQLAVASYADLLQYGSHKEAKKVGRVRLEGKEFIVEDGDIINFRFNV